MLDITRDKIETLKKRRKKEESEKVKQQQQIFFSFSYTEKIALWYKTYLEKLSLY